MINEYYILKHGNQEGPYTHTQLMDMGIGATDFLISPLADGPQQAADLPEFQDYFVSVGIYMPTPQNVATFWWRLLAFVIDYIIVIVGLVIGFGAIGVFIGLTHRSVDFESPDLDLFYRVLFFLALVAYHSIFEATTMQGSIGKLICKLIVVDPDGYRLTFGKALSRNFSKLLSSLLCGIGFLTVLWNPMKQAWHDQVAKTYVIRKGQ
jgi:uncharacterized RDD family membrane protein YckC